MSESAESVKEQIQNVSATLDNAEIVRKSRINDRTFWLNCILLFATTKYADQKTAQAMFDAITTEDHIPWITSTIRLEAYQVDENLRYVECLKNASKLADLEVNKSIIEWKLKKKQAQSYSTMPTAMINRNVLQPLYNRMSSNPSTSDVGGRRRRRVPSTKRRVRGTNRRSTRRYKKHRR